ncbi:TetR/AcrR family transcriptional regulator [Flexibacterium corallicola]|uniref:TetR/AcrR family transcriptional regulator n=1 Tax=Flexibacterium corallicola TaxID=3037259 RepID=UPI00286F7F2C|nr:TetR family transcriptional regulator [Pseudovibrio sp. M1P-2-3]
MPTEKTRQKIVTSFMSLLEEKTLQEVSFADLSEKAGVGLDVLRASFDGRLAILKEFSSGIDQKVLSERDEDTLSEPPKDRLFDVLMLRIDFLENHRGAMRNLNTSLNAAPSLVVPLNRISTTAMSWMLTAANIETTGLRRRAMSRALALGFGRVLRVWLEDEEEGRPKTLKAMEEMLSRGEFWMKKVDKLEFALRPLKKGFKRPHRPHTRHHHHEPKDETPVPAD